MSRSSHRPAQAYVTVGDAHVDTGTIERTRTWLATAKIGAEWTRTLSAMLQIVDELRKATGL